MRWSIVGLIFRRELIDQLRDRRTLFMIVVLPMLLYPISGLGMLQFFQPSSPRPYTVALVGWERLPPAEGPTLTAVAALGPGMPLSAAAVARLAQADFPPLLAVAHLPGRARFLSYAPDVVPNATTLTAQTFDSLEEATNLLQSGQVDLVLVVDEHFRALLERGQRPAIKMQGRPGDDRSRQAAVKVTPILLRYREALKETRLFRQGLPPGFDDTLYIDEQETMMQAGRRDAGALFRVMAQVFPFILVMWCLAGALYPAVDLCAGEKERGTMETLLISPVSREEIVWGKFLTIWLFSGVTAFLNLLSMGLTTWYFGQQFGQNPFRPSSLFWGTLLLLPLSAFFSAICLAVGVYARSSKEGQYYLMPLFLLTLPLLSLTLSVKLNAFYSMVPITGVALLLKAMMEEGTPWLHLATYFIPVLAPMAIYSWLALRWAIEQFQREEVLFREAEQFDLRVWIRNLFRDKEPLPGAGMALFCFGVVMVLKLIGATIPLRTAPQVHITILYLAGVLTPTLMIAVLLTTRPVQGLALRPCWPGDVLLALVLATLLVIPGALTTHFIVENVPGLKERLRDYLGYLPGALPGAPLEITSLVWVGLLLLLVSICEEVAFRGFILTGLSRRFTPQGALFLSSFLFALFPLNVYQVVPHFLLGLVLGLLTQRTGSLVPALVFHASYNALVGLGLIAGPQVAPEVFAWFIAADGAITPTGWGVGALCLAAVAALLPLLLRRKVLLPQGTGTAT
jgi:sodium transport system permease protein